MKNYAQWMADSIIARKTNLVDHWGYEYGLTLDGIARVWQKTGEKKYFDFIVETMDHFIQEDGTINGYQLEEYNIDHLNNGKILITLYKETGNERYKQALLLLRQQIETHPRTSEGAFWHKQIYPHQIWLDGLYMGAAFYAAYIKEFGDLIEFNDVSTQFIIAEKNLKDKKTGLLYHAWDEAKEQIWADKKTGLSPQFWGRAMGWYVMALVDTLKNFPDNNKDRGTLVSIFNKCMQALLKVQDQASHVWYQILDAGERKGNYLEASGSAMIVYALLKGVRNGYLPGSLKETAKQAYQGLVDEFILETKEGLINLNKICYVAGLGGKDKRDGTFAYYISEPIISNEPKGLGPFLLASAENEIL
ncbi:glycoside hydrolase family 88/105 protein [Pelosinus propionicus]|uniref:Unsaturated rhamnogalacturonyl hydrolase n=1 Tax=Pelosinus propionicus DSM 13327 TaxID=1123291 RepID=A0A1I4JWI9_9FIRM|nr:glycoside hydrolase family 105 protein [Pelosinus propionicus]SFL70466.1 unsaturated rhamnogalacturonyl hydrolase [Pelosinus propionicus DSM 13327]